MPHPQTKHQQHRILTPRPYEPTGYAPAAFKETITGPKVRTTGYVTGREADHLIRRAADKNLTIDVLHHGDVVLTATARGASAHDRITACTVVLSPTAHPKRISTHQYQDLELIDHQEHQARAVVNDSGRTEIHAGLWRIPPAAAERLIDRGWIARHPHGERVWISAAGRMAMAFRWHAEQSLHWRLIRGLYLDAALTAATTAHHITKEHTPR